MYFRLSLCLWCYVITISVFVVMHTNRYCLIVKVKDARHVKGKSQNTRLWSTCLRACVLIDNFANLLWSVSRCCQYIMAVWWMLTGEHVGKMNGRPKASTSCMTCKPFPHYWQFVRESTRHHLLLRWPIIINCESFINDICPTWYVILLLFFYNDLLRLWRTIWNASSNHQGRVTHICVSKLTIVGSDNGLAPGRRQALI